MKEYRLFDISDFAMDEDFIRWVNERSKADNDFWENWLHQHPDKYMVVAEAKRIVESIGREQRQASEFERQSEIDRLMRTIRTQPQQVQAEPAPVVNISNKKKWWYAAAAILAVMLTSGYFLLQKDARTESFGYAAATVSKGLIENINTSQQTIALTLTDGSIVELAPNSRISYANNLESAATRDVYLLGQAFFKVTKNPSRPFRVFTNEIVTKVLGTSFTVRSFETDTIIQVSVRTGKVNVYSQTSASANQSASSNQPGGIILTPNQELVYERSKQKFHKTLLERPAIILPETTDHDMCYEEVSLEKVFSQLSKYYGISIVYDSDVLKKCTVTADLRNESFYDKLALICKAVGAKYELIDGQVVIQTAGCE